MAALGFPSCRTASSRRLRLRFPTTRRRLRPPSPSSPRLRTRTSPSSTRTSCTCTTWPWSCTRTAPPSSRCSNRILKDQLERASLSVVLNCAEAGGRRSRRDKARYYAIARGSATEVAALLDVLLLRRLASAEAVKTGRRLAIRIVQMLTRIDQRLVS